MLLGPAFALFGVIYLLVVQRNDTPKFYLMKGRRADAIKSVNKIYKTMGNTF